MRLLLALALALAGVSVSVSASAQDWDAAELDARHGLAPGDTRGRAFMQDFAACLARRFDAAKDILGLVPDSDRSYSQLFLMAFGQSPCVKLEDRLRYSPRFLRGPMAEYFLKRHVAGRADFLAVYAEPSNEKLATLSPDERSGVVMIDVAECVAKANSTGVAALFETAIGSAEESAAFGALGSALSGCVPPRLQVGFTKFQLRGFLAEGAYRVAAATQGAS